MGAVLSIAGIAVIIGGIVTYLVLRNREGSEDRWWIGPSIASLGVIMAAVGGAMMGRKPAPTVTTRVRGSPSRSRSFPT